MQEIAPHVYIEKSYPGVTLGAISFTHGLILIDAPLQPDDIRLWRATTFNMNNGIDRLLVNLDEHYDRTIGVRQVECMVAGHEKMNQLFRDRPVTFKTQTQETGADWELQSGLGSIRWASPEITFSQRVELHWDTDPVILEYHPGPSACAIWVELPVQKIVFVGDAVVPNAPPFLASADLSAWKETLHLLSSSMYRDYTIVSGRGGVIDPAEVKNQVKTLDKVDHYLEKIVEKKLSQDEIERSAHALAKNFEANGELVDHYQLRLSWGLYQYVKHHHELSQAD